MSDATQDRYPTGDDLLLGLNCGSSSIKFALFDTGQSPLPRTPVWNGKVQGIGGPAPTYRETGIALAPLVLDVQQPYVSALERIREGVTARLGTRHLAAVSHRVVHGGSKYFKPIRVDAGVVADLRTYIPLAPLHQPFALEAIERLEIVATTMGFSALDGLMMGTRPGALDPGAVIYLMEIEKLSLEQVGRMLYYDSGLLGVSGLSSDPRVLFAAEARDDVVGERARAALALYVRSIVREIGSLVAVLGGLDLLVFTAGVGEHSAEIRKRVCESLGFLDIVLDDSANEAHAATISKAASRVRVGVEPTNEEWIVARHTGQMLLDGAG